jgi:MFS family permease
MLFSMYRGLPPAIYALFGARIVNRMGDFVRMFLTLYLTRVLELSPQLSGFFVMLAAVSSTGGGFIAGHFIDRYGRRKIILVSQLLSALLIGSCGFLPPGIHIPWMLIGGSLFFGAVRPAVNSMVADITSGDQRQRAFGLLYLGTNIGVAVGPMIAGFLFQNYLRWIFLGDALTTLAAMVTVLFFVPESRPEDEVPQELPEFGEVRDFERSESGNAFILFLKRPQLLFFVLLGILNNLIYSQHAFTLPLHLDSLFGTSGAAKFGQIMSFNALTVISATTLILRLTRRYSSTISMGIGTLFYLAGFGMLAFASDFFPFMLFFVSTFAWTVGEVLVVTNFQVFVAGHTPKSHRGRFNGIMQLSFGLGFILGPAISGIMVQRIDFSRYWLLVALVSLIVAAGYCLLDLMEKRRLSFMEESV